MNSKSHILTVAGLLLVVAIVLVTVPLKFLSNSHEYFADQSPQTVGTQEENPSIDSISTTPDMKKPKSTTTPQPRVETPVTISTPKAGTQLMGWVYPGEPACSASTEYKTIARVDVLKVEYFAVTEEGNLDLLTVSNSGCNGYSKANIDDIKKYSSTQYVTISSSDATSMGAFLTKALSDGVHTSALVAFVVDNDITGVELDFEDFGRWDTSTYAQYKNFVTKLGNALHAKGKKLMIDGPATANIEEENWFVWRYKDFVSLPVDHVVVMGYDYQFDHGSGNPVSPTVWLKNVIAFTRARFPDTNRLTIGIPSYGYKGVGTTQKFNLLTYDQIKREPGFSTATRDPKSFEMTWKQGGFVYFFQDSVSMSKKRQVVEAAGIKSISVWHLGGNAWFAK